MKSRLRTPTCGAARPTPSSSVHRVVHAVRRAATRSPSISSTSRARCFSTGSPKSAAGTRPCPQATRSSVAERQTRRGSTSTRSRPTACGRRRRRARRARRRASATVGARTSARVPVASTGPSTVTPAVARRPRTRPRPPPASPLSSARPPNGGNPRRRAAARLGVGDEHRVAVARRAAPPRGRAAGSGPGAARPAAVAEQPGARARAARAPAPPPAPAARAAPGRARGTRRAATGGPRAGTRCSTASVPTSTGASGTASVAASTAATSARGSSAARSSRTRATPGPHGPERACRGSAGTPAAASVAHRAAHEPVRRAARPSAPHALAARELAAACGTRGAGPGPRRLSTHTAAPPPSTRAAQRVGRARAVSSPCPGSSSRWSTTSTRGQPSRAAARSARRLADRDDARRRVGAGRDQRAPRAPARRARSSATSRAFHVGARSSSSASSPSSSTTTAREIGHRRPHRGAPADHDARARRARGPTRGARRVGVLGAERRRTSRPVVARSARRARAAARGRRVDHERRALRRERHRRRGRRAAATDRRARRTASSGRAPGTPRSRRRPRRRARTTFGGDAARRNVASGPAQRHAAHSAERRPRRPAARPTTTAEHRAAAGRASVSGVDVGVDAPSPRTRRPCSGTRTIVPTATARAGSASGSE